MVLPRVTVLIPNHNDEQYISKAIGSAVGQKYNGLLQICVVDDGSTDDSWKIIDGLFDDVTEEKSIADLQLKSGKHKGVQLTAVKRPLAGGPSAARNTGINLTINHTDVYAMLDSDDEFYPNKVSKCVELMSENPDSIGAVYADYDTYNIHTGKTIREFKEPFSRRRLLEECIVHSGSVVSKKALESTLEETGYYDELMRTCEDYDLWMRISEKFMIAHIPEALTFVRITNESSTAVVNQEVWQQNWLRVMEKMRKR
jgi:glycosyltransferase involved in cell wall biosynthesis